MKKTSPRHNARCCTIQALYQWQMSGGTGASIFTQFDKRQELEDVNKDLFRELLDGIIEKSDAIDSAFEPHLDRDISKLNPVELAIIRMGVYELQYCLNVPYRVVINEAVEIAKQFGSEAGHKYVNSILDKVALDSRQLEIQADKAQ